MAGQIDKFLDYQETVADLKRGMDRPAYILSGKETYLVKQIRDRLLASLVQPALASMDLIRFNGEGKADSIDPGRLLDEIETPSFFGGRKLISLDQTGFFATALPATEGYERLAKALTSLPEGCHLIFVEDKLVHNNRLLKAMRQAGALTAKIDFQEISDLLAWISGLCHRQGLRISREAAESLIARCQASMADIAQELETVFLYFAYTGQKDISLEDIDKLCREDMTGKIFDLTDAIAAGRVDRALEKLDVFLARRDPPLFIQTMLARQSRDLLVAKSLGTPDKILATGLTPNRFYARKLAGQAASFRQEKLEAMVEDCFQADLAVKTGRLDPQEALAILVIRACDR